MSLVSETKKQNPLVNTSFLSQFTKNDVDYGTKSEKKSAPSNKVINS